MLFVQSCGQLPSLEMARKNAAQMLISTYTCFAIGTACKYLTRFVLSKRLWCVADGLVGLSELPSVSTIAEGQAEHIKTGSTSPLALVDEIQVKLMRQRLA